MVLSELLAPAGSYEIFVIAVNAGADAVYISGERFGARAFAQNFTIEEMKKSVEYAHLNGVKLHVTVNTLVNNFEIVDLVKYLFKLYKIGVDAVIVQDFGIVYLLKNLLPNLEIHASTQMTLTDYNSVLWAADNGISRIIFPREVNVNQIASISKRLKEDNLDLDLEVFGHGALCYCVSGNCYISSYNSGRSGNRGACAQPCRKQYKLKYKNYNVGNGFLLSTHDLATYKGLDKIENAGVYSLKLEGRMKSGDYVGTIVNAYRNLIDGNEGNYEKDLNLVFNRKFTDGYLLNQKPGDVMGRTSSSHEGLYLGEISKIKGDLITIEREDKENPINLETGDGIGFKYKDKIKGIYIDNIVEQNKNHIKIRTTRNVREGNKVFLSYSKSTHNKLKKFTQETIKSYSPINLNLSWTPDLHLKISVEFSIPNPKSNNIKLNFDYTSKEVFEPAIKRPITEKDIKKQLSKTGNTSFYINQIKIEDMPENIFIPMGKLNQIRREVLDKASEILLNYYTPNKPSLNQANKTINKFLKEYKSYQKLRINTNPNLGVFIDNLDSLKEVAKFPLSKIYFDPSFSYNNQEDYFRKVENLIKEASNIIQNTTIINTSENSSPSQLIWVLSSFITEEEIVKASTIVTNLQSEGIEIGISYDVPGVNKEFNCNIYGNHNLNVWNSYSIKELADSGFKSLILSSELSNTEIKEIVSKYNYIKSDDTNLEIIVQGNLEVMTSKDDFSNLNDGKDFIINNTSDYAVLEDKKRKKFKYKVVFDYNKHSHFINKDCLCLIDELDLIRETGVDTIIVDCRFSSPKYSSTIVSLYAEALKENKNYDLNLFREQIANLSLSRLNKGNFIDGRIHEKTIEN